MEAKKMKGVSPVIATILMVMITVGLVAFSYTWFMNMGQTAQTQTGAQLSQMEKSQQGIKIGTAYCSNPPTCTDVIFEMRALSMNTLNIPTNGTSYYYNDAVTSIGVAGISGCTECNTNPELAPGQKCCGRITLTSSCKIGDKIRISIPWGAETIASVTGCPS